MSQERNSMNTAPGSSDIRRDRFDRGMEVLSRIDGEGGHRVVESLNDISPELGHQIVAWAALLHAAVYCGIPKSLNATLVAKKVSGERGLLPVARK